MAQQYHIFTLTGPEQRALKVLMEYQAYCLLDTALRVAVGSSRAVDTICNEYHVRIYAALNMSVPLPDRSEPASEKPFRVDGRTFNELRKAIINFDPKDPPKLVPEEVSLIIAHYDSLKERLDKSALFCYSLEEIQRASHKD